MAAPLTQSIMRAHDLPKFHKRASYTPEERKAYCAAALEVATKLSNRRPNSITIKALQSHTADNVTIHWILNRKERTKKKTNTTSNPKITKSTKATPPATKAASPTADYQKQMYTSILVAKYIASAQAREEAEDFPDFSPGVVCEALKPITPGEHAKMMSLWGKSPGECEAIMRG